MMESLRHHEPRIRPYLPHPVPRSRFLFFRSGTLSRLLIFSLDYFLEPTRFNYADSHQSR